MTETAWSRRAFLTGVLAAPALGLLAGCAGTVVQPGDLSRLRLMAPASPGGGWDTTARVPQRVIQSSGLAREDDDALLMMGLVMVGAVDTNDSATRLTDVTPIAQPVRSRETGADLLVIGLRRRSAVGQLLVGSAAQRILLDVDCPVLAVKDAPAAV